MGHTRSVGRGFVRLLVLGLLAGSTIAACSGSAGGATASPSSPTAKPSAAPVSAVPSSSPALASPAAVASPVSSGMFHAVDGSATGTVALFHKADGTFAITFEEFSISTIAHIDAIFVTNRDVLRDSDIDKTKIVDLGPLKGTSGMQDFSVPASADAMTYHTVVLWDTAMAHAIAAAPLH
jgi:hypothetical protein